MDNHRLRVKNVKTKIHLLYFENIKKKKKKYIYISPSSTPGSTFRIIVKLGVEW